MGWIAVILGTIIFFLLKLGLATTNCTSFRTQSNYVDYFRLDGLTNAQLAGYKVYLHLSVVANKTAGMTLTTPSLDDSSPNYQIRMFDIFHV